MSSNYITYNTKKNGNIDMNKETFARWLCLMEAFYIINKKADDLNINLSDGDYVKPLAFEKYVQQRFESMMLDLAHDEKNNLLGFNKEVDGLNTKKESVIPTIG